jgi:hypothetical protein
LKLGHYFSLCTKDLNVRPKSLKLLEENLRETLQDQGIDTDFLNMNPVAQEQQVTASIDKWNCIKIRSFCTAMEIISRSNSKRENNPMNGQMN